jgi:hypothetical protein
MSRSYKHNPWHKDGGPNYRRFQKNQANRKVRRSSDIPDGKAYRRFFNPWDIYDYVSYCPKGSRFYRENPKYWYRIFYRK